MASSGSFIPQRPTKGKVAAKSFRKIYVLSYVSYIIFFTTLIAAAGVFFYDLSLKSQLGGVKQELVAQKNLFNQADLDRVRHLNNRVDMTRQLLNSHASLVRVFAALDGVVAEPIQFLNFNYNRKENFNQPRLLMAAAASEFDEAIFQDRIFDSNDITNNFEVVNINLTTQPIDEERLELGVKQVVNMGLSAELALPEINYTGRIVSEEPESGGPEETPAPEGGGEVVVPPTEEETPTESPAPESEDNGDQQ